MTTRATREGDPARLSAITIPVPAHELGPAERLLREDAPVCWLRRGDGLVGWGIAAIFRPHGPTRFAEADKWWSEIVGRSHIEDQVGEPGSGLIAFGSFAFADDPGDSVIVVPRVVLGRRGERSWLTRVSGPGLGTAPEQPLVPESPPRAPRESPTPTGR